MKHGKTNIDILSLRAERLVVTGFRCCMAGYDLGDTSCWETAWQSYLGELGSEVAPPLMGGLQHWVRNVRHHGARPIRYFPQGCRFLCHDECMALSLLSAAQAGDQDTGGRASFHLGTIGSEPSANKVWMATVTFGSALLQAGLVLYPVDSAVVDSTAALDRSRNATASRLN